jgi:hypothetical protein
MTSRSVIGDSEPHEEPSLVLIELDLLGDGMQRADNRRPVFGLQLYRSRATVVAGTDRL